MADQDDLVWKALADPVRRELLDLLRDEPAPTGKLVRHFEQTRFGVMKHLDVLESARLIMTEKRGRERFNFLNAATLTSATARWLTPFQSTWANRLTSLSHAIVQETVMSNVRMLDIKQDVLLPASTVRVFEALTTNVDRWWDAKYRQAGNESQLHMKVALGAELVETSRDGHAVVWGRIEELRVPDRIYFSGRFAIIGAVAGRVHFDLAEAERNQTRLTLSHQAVGAIASDAAERFDKGWADLLGRCLLEHVGQA